MKTPILRKASSPQAPASESREYCFVIMSYKPRYEEVYNQICRLVEGHTKLRCIRADRDMQPGRDLLGKIHEQILGASVVVADVSELSPNVYYEYGYASAHDHLPILIARKGQKLPTDLVGKETLEYQGSPASDNTFIEKFKSCVDRQLRSPLPEQRRMLASPNPFPACLIAAPRVPGADSKHWWHPRERHTFGDMVGITGILTAYGNLFGTRQLPELLHADYLSAQVLTTPASFFCIGSSKVNPATAYFLPRIQHGLKPKWRMPQLGPGPDKRVILQGDPDLDERLAAPIDMQRSPIRDYGLIIRAPHPQSSQHLVLIVAGRHSTGTTAGCLAVTRQELITALERKLEAAGVALRDTRQPFWAIVRGTVRRPGPVMSKVEIIKAGGYGRSKRTTTPP